MTAFDSIFRWYKGLDQRLRGFPPYWRLSYALPRGQWVPPPPTPERDAAESATDPFGSLWTEAGLARAIDLARRVLTIAESHDIPLMPFFGTLLGQVREGRILPWDDDVDFALFAPEHVGRLQTACRAAGLGVFEHRWTVGWFFKIFDPAGLAETQVPWTFPFIDVFPFAERPERFGHRWRTPPTPLSSVLPGRRGTFEGAPCWLPERPLEVLDVLYPGWREWEKSSVWAHQANRGNDVIYARRIVTDAAGRKLSPASAGA